MTYIMSDEALTLLTHSLVQKGTSPNSVIVRKN